MTLNHKSNLKSFWKKIILFLTVLGAISSLFVFLCLRDSPSLLQFRTTLSSYDWWTFSSPDRSGLETLNISGSGVLHENAVIQSFKGIPAPANKIYILNLTTENQLYANGLPFRWFAWKNTPTAVKERYFPINKFKFNRIVRLKDNAKFWLRRHYYPRPADSLIETEEQMVTRLGYHYDSFYVNRREVFPPATIERFVDFVQKLPPDAWVHFHCDGGNSRTTTMMIFYDILKNGKTIPLDTIIERQYALGGVNVNDVNPRMGGTWKVQNLLLRKALVADFYRFVNDPNGYGVTKWSDWFKINGKADKVKTKGEKAEKMESS